MKQSLVLFAALASLVCACSSLPASDLAATPQRPTVSSDTSVTAEGTFELEAGLAHDPDDFDGLGTALKFGAGPRTEVYAAWSPYLRFEDLPGDDTGSGDLTLGVRHRALDETEARPAAAVLAQVKLPTANQSGGFSSGELDASFGGILTKSFDPVSLTGYYSLDVLGDPLGGTNLGHTLALAAGAPLAERVSAFAEVATLIVSDLDTEPAFTTFGLTYAPRPALVWDLAVVLGFNDDAPDFQLLFGFTRNLGAAGRAKRLADPR